MPSVTKAGSVLAPEHLQRLLKHTLRLFLSVQDQSEKTLELIGAPVQLKVTSVFCSYSQTDGGGVTLWHCSRGKCLSQHSQSTGSNFHFCSGQELADLFPQ